MRRTPTTSRHPTLPTTRHERADLERRRRRTRRAASALAAVMLVAIALPTAATAGVAPGTAPTVEQAAQPAPSPPLPRGTAQGPLATIEDEDAWCAYLSSYYLTFPSPWSARVINCRPGNLFVAPLYSDGTLGMCVLVPARHSRHLGGNVVRWVTDIRLC
ncbi:hypothetical protein [Cellulomonas phragmiteti]|uniref:Uncharacterized protein n=1 Tax=Cellulomonas phragmiteti TaxID=478780 RepID=A0ABQ4DJP7_9CELL|nr:hypothetical protein [Cellulomonas phragmiteti]GIG39578.1 hypothetical protein Cph01nite_13400 [Cellulomonas phragmiteti]